MDENKQGVTTDAARDMALRLADAQRRVNQLEAEKQASEDEKKASANALAEERKRSTGIGAVSYTHLRWPAWWFDAVDVFQRVAGMEKEAAEHERICQRR